MSQSDYIKYKKTGILLKDLKETENMFKELSSEEQEAAVKEFEKITEQKNISKDNMNGIKNNIID